MEDPHFSDRNKFWWMKWLKVATTLGLGNISKKGVHKNFYVHIYTCAFFTTCFLIFMSSYVEYTVPLISCECL